MSDEMKDATARCAWCARSYPVDASAAAPAGPPTSATTRAEALALRPMKWDEVFAAQSFGMVALTPLTFFRICELAKREAARLEGGNIAPYENGATYPTSDASTEARSPVHQA